ncbi:MAG TPA: hypothetical protein HPP77_07065 [Candidatus Hydrogenedentes bacterium]|nr:hypothetical protein [Candidatus Hydrogenedentota bacterium]
MRDHAENLVSAARSGDVDAYAELIRRFQPMALRYAGTILEDAHLADGRVVGTSYLGGVVGRGRRVVGTWSWGHHT